MPLETLEGEGRGECLSVLVIASCAPPEDERDVTCVNRRAIVIVD